MLQEYAQRDDVIVLALPRGGVPVGIEVARALNAPFDVFVVRKLGVPGREELAMGAIASGGVCVLNDDVIETLGVSRATLDDVIVRETGELQRREQLYRGTRPFPDLAEKTVLAVDDGLATGATMFAAVAALRRLGPAAIVVAVPVGSASTCAALAVEADAVVCHRRPERFGGVGEWYRNFRQIGDDEVLGLTQKASH